MCVYNVLNRRHVGRRVDLSGSRYGPSRLALLRPIKNLFLIDHLSDYQLIKIIVFRGVTCEHPEVLMAVGIRGCDAVQFGSYQHSGRRENFLNGYFVTSMDLTRTVTNVSEHPAASAFRVDYTSHPGRLCFGRTYCFCLQDRRICHILETYKLNKIIKITIFKSNFQRDTEITIF
jgi:hypothetical protein